MTQNMDAYYTSDGVEITPNLRVMTNEVRWGVIDPEQFTSGRSTHPGGEFFDGWFTVRYQDGSTVLMNGDRLRTTEIPVSGARGGEAVFAENLNPERIARVFQAEVAMHVKYGNLEAFGALRILAREISVLCAADNPAFNWVDFMRGCGFDDLEPTGTEVTLEDRLDRFPD